MASSNGINVEILSGGLTLKAYDDPDEAINGKPGEVRKYIEAMTDAKFSVAFHLTKGFKVGHCDGIDVLYDLDGLPICHLFVPQKKIAECNYNYKQALGSSTEFCATSSTWRRVEWSFGKLNIQEVVDVDASLEQLKHLGSITVNIRRVTRRKRPVPYHYPEKAHARIESVPEKLLKGQAISDRVSFVEQDVTPPPRPAEWDYLDIPGPEGRPMDFTFLYRSKHALQILGCIPRSPSPDLSFELSSQETGRQTTIPKADPTTDPSERNRKISALKAQLALLERSPNNLKSESSPSRPVKSDTPARPTAVKREYDGVEVLSERKRSRPSWPNEPWISLLTSCNIAALLQGIK